MYFILDRGHCAWFYCPLWDSILDSFIDNNISRVDIYGIYIYIWYISNGKTLIIMTYKQNLPLVTFKSIKLVRDQFGSC